MQTNKPVSGQQPVDISPKQSSGDFLTPTEESVREKKSNKWSTIGLVALTLAALGVAGFFAYRYFQLKQQFSETLPIPTSKITTIPSPLLSPQPTIDPTANWKTYTNTTYGFSLKYPHDWKILYDAQPDPTGNPTKHSVELGKDNSTLVSVTMLKSDQFQSFESLSGILNLPSGTAIITSSSEINIDGSRALYVVQNNNREGVIFLDVDNNMITIEVDSENKIILNQILSTFKFAN